MCITCPVNHKCCRPTMANSKQNTQQQQKDKRQHWTSRPKPKYDKYTRRWLEKSNVGIWTDNAIPWNRKYIFFFLLQGGLGNHIIRWGRGEWGFGGGAGGRGGGGVPERKKGRDNRQLAIPVGWLIGFPGGVASRWQGDKFMSLESGRFLHRTPVDNSLLS